jgi:hypothetical protein
MCDPGHIVVREFALKALYERVTGDCHEDPCEKDETAVRPLGQRIQGEQHVTVQMVRV